MKNKILNLTSKKISVILSSLGLSEKYAAFEYLEYILTYLIINDNDSETAFKEALTQLMNNHNLTKRSITQSLNKLLLTCNNTEITNKTQFHILNNGTLNKIRVVKAYIENKIN